MAAGDPRVVKCQACGQDRWDGPAEVCGVCYQRGQDELQAHLRGATPEEIRAERERRIASLPN